LWGEAVKRIIIRFKDGNYANIECAEMHEDDGIVKVYNSKCMLVAVFSEKDIVAAYLTDAKTE